MNSASFPKSTGGNRPWITHLVLVTCFCAALRLQAGLIYESVSPTNLWWAGGIVPYEFDTNTPMTAAQQQTYLDGLREWELAGNVHLVPRTTETNYLLLRFFFQSGTNTFLLATPPTLTVDSLMRQQITHEMGHALGLDHEHVRADRDSYITITPNLDPAAAPFYVISTNSSTNGVYDFESVMHYGRRLFALNPNQDVLVPKPAYLQKYYYRIGNLATSVGDRATVAYLYGAPTSSLTNIVTTTSDAGFGSLRAAIYYANDHPGTTVTFDIPTTDPGYTNGVWTIKPTGELPPLVADGTIIDGTTQPGYATHPVVALDGSALLPEAYSSSGLHIYAANCGVKSLAFDSFTYAGLLLEYSGAISNIIQGCHIGIDAEGTNAAPNLFHGIGLSLGASRNVIGGTNAAQRNVISGNLTYGVYCTDTNTFDNKVLGNFIGLNAGGDAVVTNGLSGIGILSGSSSNIIGGTIAGAGNVIAGNDYGVFISDLGSDGNTVLGNFIGTDATGSVPLTNRYSGIGVVAGAKNTMIGGTNASARNVISGNTYYGIYIGDSNTFNTSVLGNYIGTDLFGTLAVPNSSGIGVFNDAGNTTIGGTNAGARNVISGNTYIGITVLGTNTTVPVLQGNYIGVAPDGATVVNNGGNGIAVAGGTHHLTIGGTATGAGNLLSGNNGSGIAIYGDGTRSNSVLGNLIGTDWTGTNAAPNGGGVWIGDGAQKNTIGGTTAASRNVISGNNGTGIFIGTNSTGNVVMGNYIGVASDGTTMLGNAGTAVFMSDGTLNNTIGGTAAGAGNVISGNGDGVSMYGVGTSSNSVLGNLIGTDRFGANALPNGSGVSIADGASFNTIGGTTDSSRNLISGNSYNGIYVSAPGTIGNIIQGNFIGTKLNGTSPLPNQSESIALVNGPANNLIGGTAAGARNVIAAGPNNGVYLAGRGTSGNLVQGNFIGTDLTANISLGHGGAGVVIYDGAGTNIIGLALDGSGAGNTIAFNAGAGVSISDYNTAGNTIRGNRIRSNGLLGINLAGGDEDASGVTANDVGDGDGNPNGLQNFPAITNVFGYGTNTIISGTLTSTVSRTFIIDVYRNTSGDPSGFGEGQNYVGSTSLNTSAGGIGSFTFTVITNFSGQLFTATATDAATGDTSEFSRTKLATNSPVPAQFTGPFTQTATGFVFVLKVQTNFPMRIQAATNLATNPIAWLTLTNFTPTNTPIQFTDRAATNYQRRFYRVIAP